MVVSLMSAVSVTWHSVDTSLRAAAKSVVGDSTGREIRELLVKHNDLNTSNNKTILTLRYSPVLYTLPVLFIPPLIPTGIHRNGAEFHWNGQESGGMDRNLVEWTGIWRNGQESGGMDRNLEEWTDRVG